MQEKLQAAIDILHTIMEEKPSRKVADAHNLLQEELEALNGSTD